MPLRKVIGDSRLEKFMNWDGGENYYAQNQTSREIALA
jgi:hypothetical protein